MANIKELIDSVKNVKDKGIDTTSSLNKRGGVTAAFIGGAAGLGIGHFRNYNLIFSAAVGSIVASVIYNYYINKKTT